MSAGGMGKATTKADYDALVSSWAQRAPWYRRIFARIGLQGKLILCFFMLIAVCSGLSSVLFTRQSAQQLNDIMGEQAQQLCSALSLGTEDDIDNGRWDQLTRMA